MSWMDGIYRKMSENLVKQMNVCEQCRKSYTNDLHAFTPYKQYSDTCTACANCKALVERTDHVKR